jgi:hypothetical protein
MPSIDQNHHVDKHVAVVCELIMSLCCKGGTTAHLRVLFNLEFSGRTIER